MRQGECAVDKRYQIFISSTFRDLKEERQSVLRAILELDHMPAGMELFPATDDSAWQLIKDVIDGSDYYVLIVGGRYGSLDETGLGFTEKEYDYAIQTKKPVIPFLHENPDNLPRDKTETDAAAWEKLRTFRSKVEKKHTCVYWKAAEDLKAKVIVGLTAATKRHPAVGWVRADSVPTEATILEVLSLKNQIAELEKVATAKDQGPPPGTEELAQGSDRFEISISFAARIYGSSYPHLGDTPFKATINPTWNSMFAAVAPTMINEATDHALRAALMAFLSSETNRIYKDSKQFKGKHLVNFKISDDQIDTCIIQMRALGLIKENDKRRSVKDVGTYWTLTQYGNTSMVQLRAIRRDPVEEDLLAGEASESPNGDES
jgi:hypothetical protein